MGDGLLGDTSSKKTLSDSDIATYQRRGGPSGGAPGTDADTHAHTDADTQAQTDSDTAPKAHSDRDAVPATDRDA
ncbi:hypothetical protein [Roseicyclus persicicus]|uniref:Uncharacterized protein n=1 Tax=Roseicyclus persicicus TaxID=2650661 RepID=A0A7X6GYE9_9RHOB|nr:hypothetical protein [Roseibacterium persicicum]NKX44671.1 hypothetical protein [Roseibacterium persicicum]